jgi:CMP-N-acetylneuraminic acid synthetase
VLLKKIAMVPVRSGSVRLERKNYIMLRNKHIFERQVLKSMEAQVFDEVVINTEDASLKTFADKNGAKFYLRNPSLASNEATSDQVVLDFFKNYVKDEPASVIWVNTASPLTKVDDIKRAVKIITSGKTSSLVSVRESKGHLLLGGKPLNFTYEGGFAQTQNLQKAFEFNYALMCWTHEHIPYLESGVLFNESTELLVTSFFSNVLLKDENDLLLIKHLIECGVCE